MCKMLAVEVRTSRLLAVHKAPDAKSVAELLKKIGILQVGANYVYEELRPRLRAAITQMTEEEYQEMMNMANLTWQRVSTWVTGRLPPFNGSSSDNFSVLLMS